MPSDIIMIVDKVSIFGTPSVLPNIEFWNTESLGSQTIYVKPVDAISEINCYDGN